MASESIVPTNRHSINFKRPIANFSRRRKNINNDRSGESTQPVSSSYYNSNTNPSFSPYPTLEFDPTLKPWRTQTTSPTKKSRYSKRRTNPLQTLLPSVTSKLLASNIAVFGLQVLNPRVTQLGAKVSDLILSGKEMYRLVTPMFLHGGIAHLAINSYSLYNLGPHVEAMFGGTRFLTTYLAAGVSGNVLSALMSPNPSVGASGGIFGLIGAYYIFLNRNKQFFGKSGERGLASVRSSLVMNTVLGLSNPVIDNWGHLGGAIGGAAMAYWFGPNLYFMNLPTGRRIIVDKPIVRIPGELSELPRNMRAKLQRTRRKRQVENNLYDLPASPFRKN